MVEGELLYEYKHFQGINVDSHDAEDVSINRVSQKFCKITPNRLSIMVLCF